MEGQNGVCAMPKHGSNFQIFFPRMSQSKTTMWRFPPSKIDLLKLFRACWYDCAKCVKQNNPHVHLYSQLLTILRVESRQRGFLLVPLPSSLTLQPLDIFCTQDHHLVVAHIFSYLLQTAHLRLDILQHNLYARAERNVMLNTFYNIYIIMAFDVSWELRSNEELPCVDLHSNLTVCITIFNA